MWGNDMFENDQFILKVLWCFPEAMIACVVCEIKQMWCEINIWYIARGNIVKSCECLNGCNHGNEEG